MRKAQPQIPEVALEQCVGYSQPLTSALQLFVSKRLCGHNCWELSAQFPAVRKQTGSGWAVLVRGIAAKGSAHGDLPFMLRNYCPGLAGLSYVCIQAGQLGPWEDGEGSNGM